MSSAALSSGIKRPEICKVSAFNLTSIHPQARYLTVPRRCRNPREESKMASSNLQMQTHSMQRGSVLVEKFDPSNLEVIPFTSLQGVQNSIHQLLASWQHSTQLLQRRRWHRVKFDRQIELIPLDDVTEELTGDPRRVTGKDLSLHGVSFVHCQPLPFHKVALAFELPEGVSDLVIVKLGWCRFLRNGTYQSGGKFLRQLTGLPEKRDSCWDSLPPG